jgi:hypothetical protein
MKGLSARLKSSRDTKQPKPEFFRNLLLGAAAGLLISSALAETEAAPQNPPFSDVSGESHMLAIW